jgi:hypothetical protein
MYEYDKYCRVPNKIDGIIEELLLAAGAIVIIVVMALVWKAVVSIPPEFKVKTPPKAEALHSMSQSPLGNWYAKW